MTQYVQGPDGVVQMYADGDPAGATPGSPNYDPIAQAIAKQGIYTSPDGKWAVIGGNVLKQTQGPLRVIAQPGSQPPADVLAKYPMASPQENHQYQQQAAQYAQGEGKPVSFAQAVLTAVGSYFGASALGGLAGGAGGGLTSAAGTGLEAAEQGAATNTLSGISNGTIDAGTPTWMQPTAGGLPDTGYGANTIPVDESGIQAGVDAANSGSGYSLNGTAGAQTVAGATGAASGPFSWITAANSLPILGAAGSVGSALIGAGAAKSAANTISNAANNATAQQQQTQNTINAQNLPFQQTGTAALKDIGAGAGLDGFTPSTNSGVTPGQFTHTFTNADLNSNLAPNYQFQLDQGLGAVKNAGNLQTGLLSGNTMKGINDYAQNYAGNAYQNAFTNYNANQTNIFNRLSSIAGLGQTANSTSAQAAVPISGNIAGTTVGAAQAQAGGTVGAANAISGAGNNALSWYALNNLTNKTPTGGAQTYNGYGV